MGQALWRLPPSQQQQLQEELADRLADQEGGGRQDLGKGPNTLPKKSNFQGKNISCKAQGLLFLLISKL